MRYALEDALKNGAYRDAATELLFQLADDDFILAYRGSEWLGLAPHIEEDVAFSSISQDTMGHAAMFYQLLHGLGAGDPDHLAHARPAAERKNAVLLELVNGPGTYLTEPHYDWAFAVVRNYFYAQAKKVRIEALKNSSYQPLAEAAVKVNMELYYHLLHWKTWFTQLLSAGGEAKTRMAAAMEKVFEELDGLFSYGAQGEEFTKHKLIDSEDALKARWLQLMSPVFESLDLKMPEKFAMKSGNGRNGEHTEDLQTALDTLGEVYLFDPAASW
ncbi:1,2-phenylacetyl-CoA epoxidase subunit PaaC [Mesobacillus subterraneus]|uniref:Phenylacetate-CoA oxygenase subunit PaaI n=1 Tax=Mesobacillus subterraneus TaxID=285983 RepID=A0A427TE52_9BACI|nr:1,2-phenylacetyl-CoA epoxidase subunit PaaC [Mesobacillus subterraneus]RSD21121.1 phenylacetate-CoA oxygenase subunit PaaI [Mesobacillus subterraneus]